MRGRLLIAVQVTLILTGWPFASRLDDPWTVALFVAWLLAIHGASYVAGRADGRADALHAVSAIERLRLRAGRWQ